MSKQRNAASENLDRKYFVGLDGEGYTDNDGNHLYNLLGCSDGSYIHDDDGLSTRKCFAYLLDLALKHRRGIFVGFVFSYDVNKILTDLSEFYRFKLAKTGAVYIPDHITGNWYYVEYIPRKIFILRECVKRDTKFETIRSLSIYDVWGFFQSSFLVALKEFNIGTSDHWEFIDQMKAERSDFTTEQLTTIIEYNKLECLLLADLMEVIRGHLERVGLSLTHWHGAGAVAGALLKRETVKPHLKTPVSWVHNNAVLSAYFGGRIQSLMVGKFGTTYGYDIVSAYPSAMLDLDCLALMKETETKELIPGYRYAVYWIEWNIPTDSPITPFPFRHENGTIDYPYSGEGYYWYPEIEVAMKHFPGCITIKRGYVFTQLDEQAKPFNFIQSVFEQRKKLKAEGDQAQVVLKLALNSLYGKTAQGTGYKGSTPPYQSYIHAGLITSITRSRMLDAAMQEPYSVIAFATDGVLSCKPLTLNIGKNLGDWESSEYNESFFVKPGFYRLSHDAGIIRKVRGFPLRSVDFDVLSELWDEDGLNAEYRADVQKFIGMKTASVNRPWGSWQEENRKMTFYPARGNPLLISEEPLQYRIVPPYVVDGCSLAYSKKALEDNPAFMPDEEYEPTLD